DTLPKELTIALDPKTNTTRLVSGFCYDIIAALQDVLNFSTTVTDYSGWISIHDNSSTNVIGKALQDETKDIFILMSTFIEERARVFKILMPYRIRRIDAYFLQPKGSKLNIYWQLFTPKVWTILFTTLALLSLSKLIMEKINGVYIGMEHSENDGGNILWTTAILTQQGWNEDPKSTSLQIMFLSASVMGLICYVAFCANLVSALYFDPLPIKTFQELLQTSVRIAALENSKVIRSIIEGSTNVSRFDKEKAAALKGKIDIYCSYDHGGKLIFSKEFAFLGYEDFKTFLINEYNRSGDDFCRNIGMLPITDLHLRSGMIATKNFPYREPFNQKLIKLMETGLMYRYNRHYDMESSSVHCRIAAGLRRSVQLQLIDVYSAYVILILGKIFSLSIFLLELMGIPPIQLTERVDRTNGQLLLLCYLYCLAVAKTFEKDFLADFLSTRLGSYQVSVFMPFNVSMSWFMDAFAERNQNQISFNFFQATDSRRLKLTHEDVFVLDGTKQAFLFIPETTLQAEHYLQLVLNWAYRVPRLDDRLNIAIIFFMLHEGGYSIQKFCELLQIDTLTYATGISKTPYLYPTAMDRFYMINGTNMKENTFEIYNFGRRDAAIFELKHVPFEKIGLFTIRRTNFRKATILVATIKKDAFDKDAVTIWNEDTNQTEIIGGMSYDIITSLQLMLNFSIHVTVYNKGWNENLINHSYKDMGRILFRELEDILIVKSTFKVQRAKDFKLLVPHHIRGLYAYFIQPSIASSTNIFWNLFSPVCWGLLGALVVFICTVKFIMNNIIENIHGQIKIQENIPTIITDELIWMLAFVTQQGWTQVASAVPTRFVFFTASLMALICLTALTAQLTSALSVNTAPIKTFVELIRTNILIAVDKDSTVARDTVMGDAGEFRFDEANTRILKRNRDKYCDMLEGSKLVMEGTHTFLGYGEVKSILIDKFNRTGEDFCAISGISALPVHNLPFRSGMIATQNFPYKEFFNVKLVLLIQTGLVFRFNKHFQQEFSNVDCHYFDDRGKLMDGLQDFLFAYKILILGYILSAMSSKSGFVQTAGGPDLKIFIFNIKDVNIGHYLADLHYYGIKSYVLKEKEQDLTQPNENVRNISTLSVYTETNQVSTGYYIFKT
ncbi:unnamed protein product, partial [Allacma fusca]